MRHTSPITMFLVFLFFFTGGCRSVNLDNSGQNRAAYNYGEFVMVMHNTAPRLAAATEQAFREMDLFMVGKDVQDYSAEFKARTRKDKRVTIKIEEVNSRETMLHIKVGLRGDLKLSRALYERIETAAGNSRGNTTPAGYNQGSSLGGWDQPVPAR